ncbi:DUF1003 domain-containing protein [Sphingomonas sp. GCM10030256]|uniref:DUF1003 domain-containing protein n=1 Tax=Sphingomonas sp. GCM10030256 TaxID=3273427 RepID=UPI00361D23E2
MRQSPPATDVPFPHVHTGPTVPDPHPHDLASALERNIEALAERRRRDQAEASAQDRLAELITRFAGSMLFVYLHLAMVAGWVAVNAGLVPGVRPFDSSFVILATVASVEAIFLSTFVLISQNRAAAAADRRADLDLQVGLLAEHEVTHLVQLTTQIARKLGIEEADNPELQELQRSVAPEAVLERIEESAEQTG